MTDDKILLSIKEFLLKYVTPNIKLEKPPDEEMLDITYEKVSPSVFIGWIPPKNYLGDLYDIPGIIVMSDGGMEDDNEAYVRIRLGIATYDPGLTVLSNNKLNTCIDSQGYRDCLNLIQKIRMELSKNRTLDNVTLVTKPISWGLYEEQNYPYWHAWITFNCQTTTLNHFIDEKVNKYL